MLFRILVPTDFSPTAEKAFLYALDIAEKCAGTVFLYHVYTPLESPFIETEKKRREYNLENEKLLMNDLEALKMKGAQRYPGVEIFTQIGYAPLVGSILEFTRNNTIDLIVMGTQGASGLKKVVVGTYAARILEKTTVPLLLVPERFEWKEPKKIVMATDFNQADVLALSLSAHLAKHYGAFIEVVHLVEMPANREQTQAVFDKHISMLKKKLPDLMLTTSLMQIHSIKDALETLHQKVPYDILVMTKYRREFLEQIFLRSSTKQMAYLTSKPLLIIPAMEEAPNDPE